MKLHTHQATVISHNQFESNQTVKKKVFERTAYTEWGKTPAYIEISQIVAGVESFLQSVAKTNVSRTGFQVLRTLQYLRL